MHMHGALARTNNGTTLNDFQQIMILIDPLADGDAYVHFSFLSNPFMNIKNDPALLEEVL